MNIGIDVDGVLVDMEGYQLKHGAEYFSKVYNKTVINPKAYDIEEIFECTHEERERFWKKYIWSYCLTEPPFEGASEIIEKLHDNGHKITLITGRAHTTEKNITGKLFRFMLKYWLKKNRIFYDEIVFCSEKESAIDKLNACITKEIEVMIDDKSENLLALEKYMKVICFPAIWNQDVKSNSFIRVRDWEDIYKKIEDIIG